MISYISNYYFSQFGYVAHNTILHNMKVDVIFITPSGNYIIRPLPSPCFLQVTLQLALRTHGYTSFSYVHLHHPRSSLSIIHTPIFYIAALQVALLCPEHLQRVHCVRFLGPRVCVCGNFNNISVSWKFSCIWNILSLRNRP